MPRAFYSSLIIFISIPNQRKMDIKLLSPYGAMKFFRASLLKNL
jgi:hypothetical protein